MVTRETDYAIRTVLYLAKRPGELVSTADLAEQMHIPYRFLRKIVKKLADDGILNSYKGKNGGLELNKKPDEISIFDIIKLISGNSMLINQCLGQNLNCEFSEGCPVHRELDNVQNIINQKLQEVTFNNL